MVPANPKVVGKRMRDLRGCRTGTGVAKEIGISYSALMKYEYGIRTPNGRKKKLIAEYYGVNPDDLFYDPE